MEIPVVDFAEFLNNTNRFKVSIEVIETLKKYGFLYLKNHGISNESVEKLFLYNKEFFDKSIDFKLTVKRSFSQSLCGYDGISEEKSNNLRPGDIKEAFMMTRNDSIWPEGWNDFKEFMQEFHQKCFYLALEILRSFAIGLGLETTDFESKFINADCAFLRLIHYPPLPEIIRDNQIRAGEHTDYGG
jgi:isopenicillin N synthase-like dioxygenase